MSARKQPRGLVSYCEVGYGWSMRCHVCEATDTRVVDSRAAEAGESIRRRRECAMCGGRFTTFERVEDVPLVVIKRDGERKPFLKEKLIDGMNSAATGRPIGAETFDEIACAIEVLIKANGGQVTSDFIGLAVLDHLRVLDEVAALRFASVYKDFNSVSDFEKELTLIKREASPDQAAPSPAPGDPADELKMSLN